MKKKIIFAVATGFFAVATVFNMSVLQANSTGDVSLKSIAMMAQAYPEGDDDWFMTCYGDYLTCTFPDGFSIDGRSAYHSW